MRTGSILRGLREALAFSRGKADLSKVRIHVPRAADIKRIRHHSGLTQTEFAARMAINVPTPTKELVAPQPACDG